MRGWRIVFSVLGLLLSVSGCGAAAHPLDSSVIAAGTPTLATLPPAGVEASPGGFVLTSPAVSDGRLLTVYRGEPKGNGVEASIPLSWRGVPSSTRSLAIVMHHHPSGGGINSYLLLWGIDPSVAAIAHGAADDGPWFMGANKDGNVVSYTSPCSRGSGTHEYTVTIYALSETPASLPRRSSLAVTYGVLEQAIATVTIVGTASLTFTDTTP
jgi:phosphatidylethanolamine-binding protein (PEBP) family uncharacterized protein